MQPELLSQLYLAALRWAHILAAMVAVGGLFYARFGLLPAMQVLDEDSREKLHEGVRKRWLPWVTGAAAWLPLSPRPEVSSPWSASPATTLTCS